MLRTPPYIDAQLPGVSPHDFWGSSILLACHEGPNFLVFGLLTFTTAGHLLAEFRQDVMMTTMMVTMLLMRKMKIKIKNANDNED